MSNFDEKFSLNQTFGEEELEYYEDTHDQEGSYTQRLKEFTAARNGATFVGREDTFTPRPNNIVNDNEEVIEKLEEKAEEKEKQVDFKNVIVFEPKIEKDAESIIKKLKEGEPAVINIAETDSDVSQRVLDFVAGATFAIDGTMKRLSLSMFLAVPKKVKVIIEEVVE